MSGPLGIPRGGENEGIRLLDKALDKALDPEFCAIAAQDFAAAKELVAGSARTNCDTRQQEHSKIKPAILRNFPDNVPA